MAEYGKRSGKRTYPVAGKIGGGRLKRFGTFYKVPAQRAVYVDVDKSGKHQQAGKVQPPETSRFPAGRAVFGTYRGDKRAFHTKTSTQNFFRSNNDAA